MLPPTQLLQIRVIQIKMICCMTYSVIKSCKHRAHYSVTKAVLLNRLGTMTGSLTTMVDLKTLL